MQFWDPRRIVAGGSLAADEGPVLILQGHQNSVISVAHSPAALLFATGSGISSAAPPSCTPPSPQSPRPHPIVRFATMSGILLLTVSSKEYICRRHAVVFPDRSKPRTHRRVDSTIQATSVHGFGATASSRPDERRVRASARGRWPGEVAEIASLALPPALV